MTAHPAGTVIGAQLGREQQGKNRRADPGGWLQPGAFKGRRRFPDIQHHDHKYEQHHDGAGIDDDLQRGGERRAKDKEHQCDRE